jgi:AcrR family transcriptional regulator
MMANALKNKRRRPRQDRSKEKVDKILDAATDILKKDGPGAFNTNHIAKRAGVSIGSLYEYFPDKKAIAEQLTEDIAEEESEILIDKFKEIEQISLFESVNILVSLTFELYRKNGDMYRSLSLITSENRNFVGTRPSENMIIEAICKKLERHGNEVSISDMKLGALMIFHIVESMASLSVRQIGLSRNNNKVCNEISSMIISYLGIG